MHPQIPLPVGASPRRRRCMALSGTHNASCGRCYVEPSKLALADWLRQWLDEAQHAVARKTLERYREIVERHLIPSLVTIPLAKLQPVHVQSYYDYAQALASGRRDGTGGLSAQTVRHHGWLLNVP
jgi:Phage integrase, N-terminal SAM-like domain